MTELLRLLLDVLTAASPVRVVWSWEAGLYFFCGRYQWTTGPGLKLVIPGLCDVRRVSVVPELVETPLLNATLADGSNLTYSASITVVVRDAAAAFTKVNHFKETIVELTARTISELLTETDPEQLEPGRGKRRRLLDKFRGEINDQSREYGLEVIQLGMPNFARNIRTIRLLTDRTGMGPAPAHQPAGAG